MVITQKSLRIWSTLKISWVRRCSRTVWVSVSTCPGMHGEFVLAVNAHKSLIFNLRSFLRQFNEISDTFVLETMCARACMNVCVRSSFVSLPGLPSWSDMPECNKNILHVQCIPVRSAHK